MSESVHDRYQLPLTTRYASDEMCRLWSEHNRIVHWRETWIALAESERALGLPISAEQVAELKQAEHNIDLELAAVYEKRFRHDVMAHVHTYGDVAPSARPIIHLGATSAYVTDNADLMLIRQGLDMLIARLTSVIGHLAQFAKQYRNLATLGYTHFQPAQLTTVGKRACLWLQDLVFDVEDLKHRRDGLKLRGVKGTTGTQASFLELFAGDHAKVRELDRLVCQRLGFADSYAVTGQTYPRKIDSQVLDALSGLAQSAHKIATDLRLLAHRREVEEPFESEQIGSSAMAYKRNPMRSERICSLARFVMNLPANAAQTQAVQWFERTLDDSANRRLVIPQAFLACDAILIILANVCKGLVVNPHMIERSLSDQLPFMATETILMAAVSAGADRQEIHEVIRRHSLAVAKEMKETGANNNLVDRLKAEPQLHSLAWNELLDPAKFVGRAPEQVLEFLNEVVEPILQSSTHRLTETELRV